MTQQITRRIQAPTATNRKERRRLVKLFHSRSRPKQYRLDKAGALAFIEQKRLEKSTAKVDKTASQS